VFKGASQNSQRRVGRSSKGEQAARARKLDMIFDARASKAVRGKLKTIEDGQEARAANRALKEKLRRDAIDPAKARKRAKKIAAKQAKRMRNVIVVKKKLR
jgi:hypothetical protein